jgi:predicted DNA-binding transcriptional regulator YafY
LGPKGKEIYSRLFQEAYGVPFEMVTLLRQGRFTISQLEKKLKMSRRTVFRYLLAIEECGCTIELTDMGYCMTAPGKAFGPLLK